VASTEAFPNPFREVLNIDIISGDVAEQFNITVANYLGQEVHSERVNVASSTTITHGLNLNHLNSGIYFITIRSNSIKETLKVVKQ